MAAVMISQATSDHREEPSDEQLEKLSAWWKRRQERSEETEGEWFVQFFHPYFGWLTLDEKPYSTREAAKHAMEMMPDGYRRRVIFGG